MKKDHVFYMQKALAAARRSLKNNEVPIGAVVVDLHGRILGTGQNRMEAKGCQTGHAEVEAITKATKKRKNWRLTSCWIYVTLEPCLMCYGLIRLSRLEGLVYGAKSPLFGASVANRALLDEDQKEFIVVQGLKEQESTDILRVFFKQAREKKRIAVKQRRDFLEQIKAGLLAKKEELAQQVQSLSDGNISDQQVKDTGDEALSLSMDKLQSSIQATELGEIHHIDEALERIAVGDYGICVDCGGQISSQRLEYYPYAARCIVCQETFEG